MSRDYTRTKLDKWKKQTGYENLSDEQRIQTTMLFFNALQSYRKEHGVDLTEEYFLVRKGYSNSK